LVGALRIYEEQHPETRQVLESEAWRVKRVNLRSQRGLRANPLAKQPFPVALANALFLTANEVDDDLYHYMALLRASWMRDGEAVNFHRSHITVICDDRGEARVVKEMIFRIRDSKTDVDGEKAVSQMVKTNLASHFGDIRDLIPRLQKLKADDFVFPDAPAQYRRRIRRLLIQIAEEQPDLIPETQIDVEDCIRLVRWGHTGCGCWDARLPDHGVRPVEEPRVHKVRAGSRARRGKTCAAGTRPEYGAAVG
jgi:hypothetical protein